MDVNISQSLQSPPSTRKSCCIYQISSSFTVSNRVGPGKILAGYAYCCYCYELNDILSDSGYGCMIQGDYAGVFGLSDDDFLLSPSISGLDGMIKIAEDFSISHGLKFSTDPNPTKSKTKYIAWLKKPRPLPSLYLGGNPLPWVKKIHHLGVTITNEGESFTSCYFRTCYFTQCACPSKLRISMISYDKYCSQLTTHVKEISIQ